VAKTMGEESEIWKLRTDLSNALTELKKARSRLQLFRTAFIICLIITSLLSIGWFASRARAEQNVFAFYYAKDIRQRYGVDDLESYLNRWQWIEGSYIENKFDCSQMSACIERRLENEGYHTLIVVGKCPWDSSLRHSWLLVETNEDGYMPVEATAYRLVKWDGQYFGNYFKYDHSFETIQDALKYDYNDFKWWEG
jgi:hypothetical protein